MAVAGFQQGSTLLLRANGFHKETGSHNLYISRAVHTETLGHSLA